MGTHCTCSTVSGQWTSLSALKRLGKKQSFRVLFKWKKPFFCSWLSTEERRKNVKLPKCIVLNDLSSLFKVPSKLFASPSPSGRNHSICHNTGDLLLYKGNERLQGLEGEMWGVFLINLKAVHAQPPFSFILLFTPPVPPPLNRLRGYVSQSAGGAREGFQAEGLRVTVLVQTQPEGQQELHSKTSCEGFMFGCIRGTSCFSSFSFMCLSYGSSFMLCIRSGRFW